MIDPEYLKIAEFAVASVEGIKRTGIQVAALEDRYAKMLMPLQGNVNHVGMMYAGSLFTLGEITGGIIHIVAFDVNKFFPIVKEVTIKFKKPALTDITVEVSLTEDEAYQIQAEADEKGKADFTLNLELKDANGETVSLVSGVWQIRALPAGMEAPFAQK